MAEFWSSSDVELLRVRIQSFFMMRAKRINVVHMITAFQNQKLKDLLTGTEKKVNELYIISLWSRSNS